MMDDTRIFRPAPPPDPSERLRIVGATSALAAQLADPPIAAQPDPEWIAKTAANIDARHDDAGDPAAAAEIRYAADMRAEAQPSDPEAPAAPPKKPERPRGEIWKGCPVKALGVNGGTSYLLDALGQLRAISKLERMTIMQVFGAAYPKLCYNFPQWGEKDGTPIRKPGKFDGDSAAAAITQACAEQGIFDPEGAVRGVGAWADDEGQLVYHLGDALYIAGERVAPCTHQGRIYPAQPAIPHPSEGAEGADAAYRGLIDALDTWSWQRPDLDPMILAGTIGVQMFGGALDWRPATWVTGGAGSGKSALQKMVLHLHGGEKGLVQSTDPTARGIAAQLQQSTLPVALDELEPGDAGSHKERAIIETARVSASGGRWMRGSSDQKGSSGQMRSTFMFSSIIIPGALKSQDKQRLIILNLLPIRAGATPPSLRPDTWRGRGSKIKAAIIDRWPTWAARLQLWRDALEGVKITGRNADNWATTLAMACMMRQAAMPTADELAGWAAKVSQHITADLAELGNDADEVLVHLLGQTIDPMRRGEQYTIAEWVQVAAKSHNAPRGLCGVNDVIELNDEERTARAKIANSTLSRFMLRVIEHGGGPHLFVSTTPTKPILDLFRDTQWQGGAWGQSLERVKGASKPKSGRTLAGTSARGVEIPLSSIPGLLAFPADRGAPMPATVHPMRADLPPDMGDFA